MNYEDSQSGTWEQALFQTLCEFCTVLSNALGVFSLVLGNFHTCLCLCDLEDLQKPWNYTQKDPRVYTCHLGPPSYFPLWFILHTSQQQRPRAHSPTWHLFWILKANPMTMTWIRATAEQPVAILSDSRHSSMYHLLFINTIIKLNRKSSIKMSPCSVTKICSWQPDMEYESPWDVRRESACPTINAPSWNSF